MSECLYKPEFARFFLMFGRSLSSNQKVFKQFVLPVSDNMGAFGKIRARFGLLVIID